MEWLSYCFYGLNNIGTVVAISILIVVINDSINVSNFKYK